MAPMGPVGFYAVTVFYIPIAVGFGISFLSGRPSSGDMRPLGRQSGTSNHRNCVFALCASRCAARLAR